MKTMGYFVLLLIGVPCFSSCTVRKAGISPVHYKNEQHGKYFMYNGGYEYVHTRPPID